MKNNYEEYGGSRAKYLESLAEDYGISPVIVFSMADALGPNEDFDGLICELEDAPLYFSDEDEDYCDF